MDYIALARSKGAKLDQADNGFWRVLDMPGTLLWLAWFTDERMAAWAFCYQVNLISRDHFPVEVNHCGGWNRSGHMPDGSLRIQ